MRRVLFPASLILILGCKGPDLATANFGPQPTPEECATVAKGWCNANLKDPWSAVIQNARVVGKNSVYNGLVNGGGYTYGWEIRFEVNAKNSYGGYTGFKVMTLLITADKKLYALGSV